MVIPVKTPTDWSEYQLLDSGGGEKLENFSAYTVVRPDPRVIWSKKLSSTEWQKADAIFDRKSKEGGWIFRNKPPLNWMLNYKNLKFSLQPTDFRHVGIFPEQAVNWDWLTQKINSQPLKVLNLFAYTGGATIAAAKAGANVTHVDSSKSTITWANQNAKLNNLPEDSIRWILEDAYKFVEKEIRRANIYDGIILDPPRFGHGTKGEIWQLHDDLSQLISNCRKLLSKDSHFLLLNVYTADLSSIAIYQLVKERLKDLGGTIDVEEIALKENNSDRLLPTGIVARWSK